MSNLTTLARPYAKAAFELAFGDDKLPDWDDWLGTVAAATSEADMVSWLQSPHYDAETAVKILLEVLGEGIDARFQGYLGVLADNNRLLLCLEVRRLYSQLRQAAEKRLEVRVVSAVELEKSQADRMCDALTRRLDREITLNNEVDPSVLGGAVIYAGDQVIDGSLKGRLARLESSLS
jgi:F-type H+-transporting ATPase subunit delta